MKKIKGKAKFFKRLLIYFVGVSLIPSVLLGMFILLFSNRIALHNVENQLQTVTQSIAQNMDEFIEEYKKIVGVFATDEEVITLLSQPGHVKFDENMIFKKIYFLMAGQMNAVDFYVIKRDGSFHIGTQELSKKYNVKQLEGWGIFRMCRNSQGPVVYSNRYINENGVKIAFSIAQAIRKREEIVGYVIMDIPEKKLDEILDRVKVSLPIAYTLMDSRCYIIYDEMFKAPTPTFFNLQCREKFATKQSGNHRYRYEDQMLQMSYQELPLNSWRVLCSVPIDLVIQNNNYIALTTMIIAFIGTILSFCAALAISKRITKPIYEICKVMNEVEKGDLTASVTYLADDEIGFMGMQFNKMIYKVDELFKRDLEKQDRLRLAEIKQLQAQINPHFLYNTLDSIKWLAKLNQNKEVVILITQLGILLKNSIHMKKDYVTVEESLKIINSYLSIQQIRYPDKFETIIDIDPTILKYEMPKLILQPVVENAIVHGIENKVGYCHLSIKGYAKGGTIFFEIRDDGIGIDERRLQKLIQYGEVGDEHIGISNVNKRIKLCYGDAYGVKIESKIGEGTTVKITMQIKEMWGR